MNTMSKVRASGSSGSGRPDRYWSTSLAWTSAEWSSPSLSALARRERIEDSEESTKSTCAAPRDMASKPSPPDPAKRRSEEHTSELQSRFDLVCRLLLGM